VFAIIGIDLSCCTGRHLKREKVFQLIPLTTMGLNAKQLQLCPEKLWKEICHEMEIPECSCHERRVKDVAVVLSRDWNSFLSDCGRVFLRGYFVVNELQMWENSDISRLFLLPVMWFVCCVKCYRFITVKKMLKKHNLLVNTAFAEAFLIHELLWIYLLWEIVVVPISRKSRIHLWTNEIGNRNIRSTFIGRTSYVISTLLAEPCLEFEEKPIYVIT